MSKVILLDKILNHELVKKKNIKSWEWDIYLGIICDNSMKLDEILFDNLMLIKCLKVENHLTNDEYKKIKSLLESIRNEIKKILTDFFNHELETFSKYGKFIYQKIFTYLNDYCYQLILNKKESSKKNKKVVLSFMRLINKESYLITTYCNLINGLNKS